MERYQICPNRESLHGILWSEVPPVLRCPSGSIIDIQLLEPDWRIEKPHGKNKEAAFFPRRKGYDDGHALCGPIYINELRPGMALKVEILEIETDNWGWSSVGIGNQDHLHKLCFEGDTSFWVWDIYSARKTCVYDNKFCVPIDPFPGVLAVAPKGKDAERTHIPGNHGGNLDCKELRPGSTLYLPVFHEGGLLSVGDGHAAQGDGESGGTAIECPYKCISLKVSAADFLIESPVADTKEGWITFGFNQDLTLAAYEALHNMRKLMKHKLGIENQDAMNICSIAVDLHVTQIVNGIRGVHAIFPHEKWEHLLM